MEPSAFYPVDLHVHTPASKCFRGETNDEGYLGIIGEYVEKDVKIICITDHNTVSGYDHLMVIKNKYESILDSLNTLDKDSPDMSIHIQSIRERYGIFNKIIILPGIEIELKPGVHFLVIFNPETYSSDVAKQLLCDIGFLEEMQGREDLNDVPNFDPLDFYQKIKDYDCLVVAAHVDSNKGIYNATTGVYRAAIFKSPILNGVQYKSSETAAKIKSIIRTQKEYKRDKPLAYIQASDYHGENSIFQYSYYKLNDFTYKSLYECFENPVEMISVLREPEFGNVVDEIKNNGHYVAITGKSNLIAEPLSKNICASLNASFGSILVGFQDKPTFEYIGINCTVEQLGEIINGSIDSIYSRCKGYREVRVITKSLGDNNAIGIIFISAQTSRIHYFENKAYVYLDNLLTEASPCQIESIVEENMMKQLFKREKKNLNSYESIKKNIDCLMQPVRDIKLINLMHYFSKNIISQMKLNLVKNNNEEESTVDSTDPIGTEGNYPYYVSKYPSRLEYAYLRVSCPQYDIRESNLECFNGKGKAIVVASGGGCFYIDNESDWKLYTDDAEVIILYLKNGDIDLKLIVAWLKSTYVFWYSLSEFDQSDFFNLQIFRTINIPDFPEHASTSICDNLNTILALESSFLVKYSVLENEEEKLILVNEHNLETTKIGEEIDKIIYETINLSDHDVEYIEKSLRARNEFCYSDCRAIDKKSGKMINE